MRYRLDIPADGDGGPAVADVLERWSRNRALRALVEADGGAWPTNGSLLERLEQVHEFSQRWDFRRGGERLDISAADIRIPESRIQDSARALGMTDPPPPDQRRYDHAIVLGGTALASYCRTKLVADLLGTGVEIGQIGSLGAFRSIGAEERRLAEERRDLIGDVGSVPDTEFDVLVDAATRFLPPASELARDVHENSDEGLRSGRVGYRMTDGREVEVIAAASLEPGRRATTLDNYHSYAERINEGDSVLICTSAIYAPYHFFVAVRALGWSRPIAIEVAGFPPEWMRGVLTAPHNYLQETRSAIFGALSLARELET